jgi:hypothetical protein
MADDVLEVARWMVGSSPDVGGIAYEAALACGVERVCATERP